MPAGEQAQPYLSWEPSVVVLTPRLLIGPPDREPERFARKSMAVFGYLQEFVELEGVATLAVDCFIPGTEAKVLWVLYHDNLRVLRRSQPRSEWPELRQRFKEATFGELARVHNCLLWTLIQGPWGHHGATN